MHTPTAVDRFVLGALVGDAVGLPFEGLSRRRVDALLRDRPLDHRLLFGRGMVSDDTDHMMMTLSAYAASGPDHVRFRRALARRLRLWMLAIPPACGMATAKACLRLVVGIPASRSGVSSAGNGPVMRAGVLGLLAEDTETLALLVRAATTVKHTDERAVHGALAVALAARVEAGVADRESTVIERFSEIVKAELPVGEMRSTLEDAIASARAGDATEAFADALGCEKGVSGFVMHTVPVVLHAWMRRPQSYESGITLIIRLGGDTDTTAFVLGGLLGIHADPPQRWADRVMDFPMSKSEALRIAASMRDGKARRRLRSSRFALMPLRNVVFLLIILVHAARRLAPPY